MPTLSDSPVISVRGLTKEYWLGQQKARSGLSEAMANAFRRKSSKSGQWFRALDDVSFDVAPGNALGIIGRNGAGKSTLLKILSRITRPTSGEVILRGRVGSLLEVGTGFHAELTGRENVFMNGAILGMRKIEIERKFDEIVAFAEVERFIDTPVKRYSSGMNVRLAFAVAAHLEPEILMIDEVLAVGDIAFQKKCLGKMGEVAGEGRTVLFVSHNTAAIQQLTTECVLLHAGAVVHAGPTGRVLTTYLHAGGPSLGDVDLRSAPRFEASNGKQARIVRARLVGDTAGIFAATQDFGVRVQIEILDTLRAPRLAYSIFRFDGTPIGTAWGDPFIPPPSGSRIGLKMTIPCPSLAPGRYYLALSIGRGSDLSDLFDYDVVMEALHFEVAPATDGDGGFSRWPGDVCGNVRLPTPIVKAERDEIQAPSA